MPDITAPLVNFATEQVGSYGALAVFVLMVLESACIPVPSEAIMLYGGFLVGRGDESFWLIVAAGVAGNVIGSWIAYWVGYKKGREWLLRWHWLHVTPKRLDSADRWFDRYGDWAVLLSRCIPIVRTFISLPAGFGRMKFWKFTLFTLLGCIPWVVMLGWVGTRLGSNWEKIRPYLHIADYVVVAAVVVFVVWALVKWRRHRGSTGGGTDTAEYGDEA